MWIFACVLFSPLHVDCYWFTDKIELMPLNIWAVFVAICFSLFFSFYFISVLFYLFMAVSYSWADRLFVHFDCVESYVKAKMLLHPLLIAFWLTPKSQSQHNKVAQNFFLRNHKCSVQCLLIHNACTWIYLFNASFKYCSLIISDRLDFFSSTHHI